MSKILHLCKYCLDTRGEDPNSPIIPRYQREICDDCQDNAAKYAVEVEDAN